MNETILTLLTKQSELRQKINELSAVAEPSDTQTADLTAARTEAQALEPELRTALVAASEPDPQIETRADGETAELRELRGKAKLPNYVFAAINGAGLTGAEAEFAAARACGGGTMPLDMLMAPREERAVTPGVTEPGAKAPIAPKIFERTAAAALGVQFPTVETGQANYPVLTTVPTASSLAKDGAAPSTAGAFRLDTRTPKRVSGQFEVRVEDLALLPGMEESLRGAIDMVLGEALDKQVFTGNGTDPNFSGVFVTTANVAIASAVETFKTGVSRFAALVDGQYAYAPSDMRAVIGVDTYSLYAGLFQGSTNVSLYDYLVDKLGGLRVSKRVPAKASSGQKGIVALTAGSQPIRVPVWQGVQLIRDPFTGAGKGQVTVTALLLAGDPHLPYGASSVKEVHPKLS